MTNFDCIPTSIMLVHYILMNEGTSKYFISQISDCKCFSSCFVMSIHYQLHTFEYYKMIMLGEVKQFFSSVKSNQSIFDNHIIIFTLHNWEQLTMFSLSSLLSGRKATPHKKGENSCSIFNCGLWASRSMEKYKTGNTVLQIFPFEGRVVVEVLCYL